MFAATRARVQVPPFATAQSAAEMRAVQTLVAELRTSRKRGKKLHTGKRDSNKNRPRPKPWKTQQSTMGNAIRVFYRQG
jgi:hypothetical protein